MPVWSTTDEIRFINGLGHHRDRRTVPSFEKKLTLLRGYLQGCQLRTKWVGLNREEIVAYVENRIDYYSRANRKQILEENKPHGESK